MRRAESSATDSGGRAHTVEASRRRWYARRSSGAPGARQEPPRNRQRRQAPRNRQRRQAADFLHILRQASYCRLENSACDFTGTLGSGGGLLEKFVTRNEDNRRAQRRDKCGFLASELCVCAVCSSRRVSFSLRFSLVGVRTRGQSCGPAPRGVKNGRRGALTTEGRYYPFESFRGTSGVVCHFQNREEKHF